MRLSHAIVCYFLCHYAMTSWANGAIDDGDSEYLIGIGIGDRNIPIPVPVSSNFSGKIAARGYPRAVHTCGVEEH